MTQLKDQQLVLSLFSKSERKENFWVITCDVTDSARRFATLIDLINQIGLCNRMIDYRKQKSIISESIENSASFAEVQL